MFVDDDWEYFAGDLVDLVAVETSFLLHVLAAFVNDDFVESLDVSDSVLDGTFPLLGRGRVEPISTHVTDRLGPRFVALDWPLLGAGHRVPELLHLVQLDANAISLVFDEEAIADDERSDQRAGISSESEVRAEEQSLLVRLLVQRIREALDADLLPEDDRIADLLRQAFPDVEIRLVVRAAHELHLASQDVWEVRVRVPVQHLDERFWGTILLVDEANVSWRVLRRGVERRPDLRSFLPDRRNQDLPRIVCRRMRLFHPALRDAFRRFDLIDVVMQSFEDERAASMRVADRLVRDVEAVVQSHATDRVAEQLVHGVLDRVLILARAENTLWPIDVRPDRRIGESNERLRYAPGLRAASAAVEDLVTRRLHQVRQRVLWIHDERSIRPHGFTPTHLAAERILCDRRLASEQIEVDVLVQSHVYATLRMVRRPGVTS